jgi:hypothetical protein
MAELEYNLAEDDFIAYNMHFADSSRALRRPRLTFRMLVTLSGPAMSLLISILTREVHMGFLLSMSVVTASMWFVSPSLWKSSFRRSLLRMSRHGGLGSLGRYVIKMDESGLREESPSGITLTSWGQILRIEETDEYAFIFSGPINAFIIPKRVDREKVTEFLSEARRRNALVKGEGGPPMAVGTST